jgi:hypothetical protein
MLGSSALNTITTMVGRYAVRKSTNYAIAEAEHRSNIERRGRTQKQH